MSKNKTQITISLLNEQLQYIDDLASKQIISRGQAVRQIIKEMMSTGVPSNLTLSERVSYLEDERNKLMSLVTELEYQITYIKGQIDA
jgi:metal-responsive CopG/Arc/MetJ family transcriptional regulator